jgi:hypothetical protein
MPHTRPRSTPPSPPNRRSKPVLAAPKLRLDADSSIRAQHKALLARGHDVTRTPADWIAADASNEEQLLASTTPGRCLFTFNVRDFSALARRYPQHGGLVLAAQAGWRLPELIAALDRLLSETQAEGWTGRVRWLNGWRVGE